MINRRPAGGRSRELDGGLGISGIVTAFFRPSDPADMLSTEPTFVIEKKITEQTSLFIE
jgi:hypothetical protein